MESSLECKAKLQEMKELHNMKLCLFSLTFLKTSYTYRQTLVAFFLFSVVYEISSIPKPLSSFVNIFPFHQWTPQSWKHCSRALQCVLPTQIQVTYALWQDAIVAQMAMYKYLIPTNTS